VNGRANANAGLGNAAARNNMNGQTDMIGRTPFFSDPGARQQLNMNNNQFNSLNSAYSNAYTRYNQAVNNLDPNLTAEQRAQQMQQLQSQFNQDLSGTVNSTLTDPQSRSRFGQLNRQFMGFNAFNDPQIRQQLNLTPEQTRQLRTLSNNWRQQLQQFRRGAGNNLTNVDQGQWTQMWQQYATQLNGVLTPEQQQIWTQQIGQPYTFSPNVFMGDNGGTNQTQVGSNVAPNGQQRIGQPYNSRGNQGTTGTTGTQGTAGTGTQQTGTTGTQGTATQGSTATQGTGTRGTATQGTGTQGSTAQGTTGGTVR
jgi:hypothetical protein